MLGADLRWQRFEDNMEQNLTDEMNKIQHALKLKEMQRKGARKNWKGQVITPCPFELYKTPNGHHHSIP